jgi:hypothetical protein
VRIYRHLSNKVRLYISRSCMSLFMLEELAHMYGPSRNYWPVTRQRPSMIPTQSAHYQDHISPDTFATNMCKMDGWQRYSAEQRRMLHHIRFLQFLCHDRKGGQRYALSPSQIPPCHRQSRDLMSDRLEQTKSDQGHQHKQTRLKTKIINKIHSTEITP